MAKKRGPKPSNYLIAILVAVVFAFLSWSFLPLFDIADALWTLIAQDGWRIGLYPGKNWLGMHSSGAVFDYLTKGLFLLSIFVGVVALQKISKAAIKWQNGALVGACTSVVLTVPILISSRLFEWLLMWFIDPSSKTHYMCSSGGHCPEIPVAGLLLPLLYFLLIVLLAGAFIGALIAWIIQKFKK